MFISLKEMRWVKLGSIKGVLSRWNRDGKVTEKDKRWKIVRTCIWTVWTERNKRCFEDVQNNLQKI